MSPFAILIINFIVYIFLFIKYQKRKQSFDLGSILLLTWIVGSGGAVWYYSFQYTPLYYPNITVWPLVYLLCANIFLFYPFLKTDYKQIHGIDVYKIANILKFISAFFSIIIIPPFIFLLFRILTFRFGGNALAEMYSAEIDKISLLFPSFIKPFYSIVRHFTQFIIFLFFYNLTIQRKHSYIIYGLGMNLLTFFFVAILTGSRGGVLTLLLSCCFYYFFMYNIFSYRTIKTLKWIGGSLLCLIFLGICAISVSRLDAMNRGKNANHSMDVWIAQYAGEGIIRFDNTAWNLEQTLNGYQTLPVLTSLYDARVKDTENILKINDKKIGAKTWVFYTYLGDFIIDFGKIGGAILVLLFGFLIRWLSKISRGRISMFKLIILNYCFIILSIGITADLYRTYYTQIEMTYVLGLLLILYFINSYIPSRRNVYNKIGHYNPCV